MRLVSQKCSSGRSALLTKEALVATITRAPTRELQAGSKPTFEVLQKEARPLHIVKLTVLQHGTLLTQRTSPQ